MALISSLFAVDLHDDKQKAVWYIFDMNYSSVLQSLSIFFYVDKQHLGFHISDLTFPVWANDWPLLG